MRTADRYGKWQTTEALSSPAAVAAPCPGAAERRMTNDRYRGVGSRNDIYAVWSNEIPDYYRGCAAIFRIKHREVHYNILFGVYLFILFSFPCFIFYEVNFFFGRIFQNYSTRPPQARCDGGGDSYSIILLRS